MGNVKLIWATPNAEQLIVKMARVSAPANQDNMDTAPRLLNYLIKHKHWSPYEMANLCVEIETTRGISAQILRHRSFSFQEFCLSGDTVILVSGGPGTSLQRLKIKDLFNKWNKSSFKARFARSYDTDIKRFIDVPILSVYESGEKPVYRFFINTGHSTKTIDCTNEHKVLTKEKGFVDFSVAYTEGLTIALNGEQATPLPYQDPQVLQQHAWMGSEKFALEFGIKSVTARKWFRQHGIKPYNSRTAPKTDINPSFNAKKTSFMTWARKNILKEQCEKCGHKGTTSRLELSHVIAHDGDPALCFDEDNLQTLCASCHRKHDIQIQGKKFGWTVGMTAKWGTITTREFLGMQPTYDIEMDHPTHNFVANGIIVHNSQRYADVGELGSSVVPHLRRQDSKNRQNSIDDLSSDVIAGYYRRIGHLFEDAEHLYREMVSAGVAKECARNVLPIATKTRMYMNGTLRSYIHYLQVRTHESTQLEHRQIAEQIKDIFCEQFPIIGEAVFSVEGAASR